MKLSKVVKWYDDVLNNLQVLYCVSEMWIGARSFYQIELGTINVPDLLQD